MSNPSTRETESIDTLVLHALLYLADINLSNQGFIQVYLHTHTSKAPSHPIDCVGINS